jgi:hypothetical protein
MYGARPHRIIYPARPVEPNTKIRQSQKYPRRYQIQQWKHLDVFAELGFYISFDRSIKRPIPSVTIKLGISLSD